MLMLFLNVDLRQDVCPVAAVSRWQRIGTGEFAAQNTDVQFMAGVSYDAASLPPV